MTPEASAFRRVAVQVASRSKLPFKKFLDDFGLEDILERATAEGYTSQDIAVAVLTQCCVADGTYNNFQVGLLSVMTFLNEQFGDRGTQPWRDLVSILDGGGEVGAVQGWMDTHYPEP